MRQSQCVCSKYFTLLFTIGWKGALTLFQKSRFDKILLNLKLSSQWRLGCIDFFVHKCHNLLWALLGKKNCVDVGKDTTRCNSYSSQKFIQFFIIFYCKSNVSWHNTRLCVVTSSVSSLTKEITTDTANGGNCNPAIADEVVNKSSLHDLPFLFLYLKKRQQNIIVSKT